MFAGNLQIKCVIAGLAGSGPVKCSREVVLVPDTSLEEAKAGTYDAVILPGGLGGTRLLQESDLVRDVLKKQEESGRLIAAICAGV